MQLPLFLDFGALHSLSTVSSVTLAASHGVVPKLNFATLATLRNAKGLRHITLDGVDLAVDDVTPSIRCPGAFDMKQHVEPELWPEYA